MRFWITLRCGPIRGRTAEPLREAIEHLGPWRPRLRHCVHAMIGQRADDQILLVAALRRGPSGKAACEAFTSEVRQLAALHGIRALPVIRRSAVTVERDGWLRRGWGDVVFEDRPGSGFP